MTSTSGQNYSYTFEPEAVLRHVENAASRGVGLAAQAMAGDIKMLLSKPGPTKTHRTGSTVPQRRGGVPTGRTVMVRASRPGEPPRRRTGRLRASIIAEPLMSDGSAWRVGTALPYGLYLELGVGGEANARPFLRPTMERWREQLLRTVADEVRLVFG